MKTIYVHIGTPKTGTTSLQHFLSLNKSKLLDDGLCYLTDSQGVSALGIAVALGFWEDHDPHAHVEDLNRFREEMRAAMEAPADIILLSSEMFCETTAGHRRRLIRRLHAELTSFGADRIIAICYLRRQDLFIESRHANDIVHWGISPSVNDADPEIVAYADYYRLLSDYKAIFGDNLIVRLYEKGQLLKGDIIDDFLEQLGLPRRPEYALPDRDEWNGRIRGDLTEMLRLYNLSGLGEGRNYSFVRGRFLPGLFTPEQWGRGPGKRFLALDKKKRTGILKRYESSNRKVAVQFMGRKDGKLFRDAIPSPPSDNDRGPRLQVEEITPLFMHMITGLFERTEPLLAQMTALQDHSRTLDDRSAGIERRLKDAEERYERLEAQLHATQERCGHLESQWRETQERCGRLESYWNETRERSSRTEQAQRDLEWRLATLANAKKKLVGWGTTMGFKTNHFKNPVPLAYLIDNDSRKWGEHVRGIPVRHPGTLEQEIPSDVIVVVYSSAFDEIAAQIARIGNFTVIPADVFSKYAPPAPQKHHKAQKPALVERSGRRPRQVDALDAEAPSAHTFGRTSSRGNRT